MALNDAIMKIRSMDMTEVDLLPLLRLSLEATCVSIISVDKN